MATTTPEDQRRVEQAPIPAVRIGAQVTPETMGAGVAQVGERAGLVLAQRAAQEANETAVLDADTQLARQTMDIQTRMGEMRGKDAMRAIDFAKDSMGKAVDQLDKSLSNNAQRLAFRRRAQHRALELENAAHMYMAKESAAYQDQVTEDSLKASVDNARLNAGNPELVNTEKASQALTLSYWAQRHGVIDGPQFKQRVAEAHSVTNREVIRGLMNQGKDRAAQAYYDENKEQFTAQDRDVVEKLLDEGSTRRIAQRSAREIIANNPNDLGEAIKAVEKIDDPKIEQFTRDLVKQHFGDLQLAKKQDLDDLYLASTNMIDNRIKKNPGVPFIARDVIPPDKWMWFSIQEKDALQRYIDIHTKPADRPNDDEKWLGFMALTVAERGALSQREYDSKYRQFFNNAGRHYADQLWMGSRDAVNKNDEKDPELTQTVTPHQQIIDTFRTSGLVRANKELGEYDRDEVRQFVRFVQQSAIAIEQEEVALKRKLRPSERQQVIDSVRDQAIKKVWTPGILGDMTPNFIFGSTRFSIALEEDEKGRAAVSIKDIPPADLDQLKGYIASLGKPVTPEKLRRAYPQWKIFNNRKAFDAIVNE